MLDPQPLQRVLDARAIVSRESPCSSADIPTLVAITSSSRLPRAAIQRPMMRSEPPGPSGPRRPYTSAVSMKLPPARE